MSLQDTIAQQLSVYGFAWITAVIGVVWTVLLIVVVGWVAKARWYGSYKLFADVILVEKNTTLELENERLREELAEVTERKDDLARRMSVIDEASRGPLVLLANRRARK